MAQFDVFVRQSRTWLPLAFAVGIAAVIIITGIGKKPDPLIFSDTDEAMRLVQLRDFLAGQPWRDLVPHRLDPAANLPMHWSRFVDLSLALLFWPLSVVMSPAAAERLMAIVWPPLMFVLCAVPLIAIARRFGGLRIAFCVVVLALGPASLFQFLPGRIDHHSAQMAAALFAILATMQRQCRRKAALAGFATAFALSLGIETIPFLIVLACFFGADFVRGVRLQSVRAYAATLALSAIGLFVLTTEPRFFFLTACDVLTFNVAAGVVVGGAGLFCATLWAERAPRRHATRMACLALVAALALGISLAIEPRCAHGVIGTFDPQIRPVWFDSIEEVASAFKTFGKNPRIVIQWYLIPLLTLILLALNAKNILRRDDGRIMAACFVAALIVALWQIRGTFYASVFAAPLLAAWIARMVSRVPWLQRWKTAPLFGSIAIIVLAINLPYIIVPQPAPSLANATQESDCTSPAALRPLAAMSPGLVLAPIDYGPFILLYTPHSVLSAPYHRFDRGIVLGQSILYLMDWSAAEQAMAREGIDYVVLCGGGNRPLLEVEIDARHPAWLHEMSPPGAALRIFRVERQNEPARTGSVVRLR